jgi:hypothetical protein
MRKLESFKKEINQLNIAIKGLKKDAQELKSERVKILKKKDDTIQDLLTYKVQKSSEEKLFKRKEKKPNQKLKRIEKKKTKREFDNNQIEKQRSDFDENENLETVDSDENSAFCISTIETLNTFQALKVDETKPDATSNVINSLGENLENLEDEAREPFEYDQRKGKSVDNFKEKEDKIRAKIRLSIKNKVESKVNAGLLSMVEAKQLELELMEEMEEAITEEIESLHQHWDTFYKELDEPLKESEEEYLYCLEWNYLKECHAAIHSSCILVRAECMRCPWLLATILGIILVRIDGELSERSSVRRR